MMDVRQIGSRLYIDGFIYRKTRADERRGITSWRCVRWVGWRNENLYFCCPATAATAPLTSSHCTLPGENIIVHTGPFASPHNHPPILEDIIEAQGIVSSGVQDTSERRRIFMDQRVVRSFDAPPRPCGPDIAHFTGLKNTEHFVIEHDAYIRFLSKLAEKPIFDRHHIVDALFRTYNNESDRFNAYAIILKYEERVAHDFGAFKRSLDHTVQMLKQPQSMTRLQENSAFQSSTIHSNTSSSNINLHLDALKKLTRRVGPYQRNARPAQRVRNTERVEEKIPKEVASKSNDIIPPVPAAIPIREFLASSSLSTTAIDLPDDGIKVKKEIEVIDVTDDDDTNPECFEQRVSGGEQTLQPNIGGGPILSQERVILSECTTSSDITTTETGHLQIHPNLVHDSPNLNNPGVFGHIPGVPPRYLHPETQTNTGIPRHPPFWYPGLNAPFSQYPRFIP